MANNSAASKPPTVLITRPEAAAARLAQDLRVRWTPPPLTVISPMMRTEVIGVDIPLNGVRALVFTSRAGVEAFAQLSTRRDLPCHVVGEATRAAAEDIGLNATCEGPDAAALARALAAAPPGGPLLHLRGAHVAGDLAGRLHSAGITLREAVIYRQRAQPLTARAMALLGGGRPVIVPLFSPRSAQLFFAEAAGAAPLLCAAFSGNVAAEVPAGRAARLVTAAAPQLNAMLDSLDDLRDYANRLEAASRAQ